MRRVAAADFIIATNGGRLSHFAVRFSGTMQSMLIADFYLIRALFRSRESLEPENAELRRQIAALEAEAAIAKIEDKDKGKS